MKPTDEQNEIVEYEGDLAVSACAGSGKSSTLRFYCERRSNSPTLYLVYNKAVKLEAIHKFQKVGLDNVRIETLHSLAYSELKKQNRKIKLHEKGQYKPLEVSNILGLGTNGTTFGLIMATHILNFLNFYFNSAFRQLAQARGAYLDTIRHEDFKRFANSHFDTIVGYATKLLKRMYEGESDTPMVHDAYLKFWLMENPQLPFKYIAVDEAQDSTMALLDMLGKQNANKILVGDGNQGIYGFRFCVNAMELMGFPQLSLSTSFRFGQGIANKGMEILRYKERLGLEGGGQKIIGAGGQVQGNQVGIIARSNVSLLAQAIMDFENGVTKSARIGFEGGLKSYTFFGKGNLHDVLWLYCGKLEKIKDPFIQQFESFKELIQFQKEVDDRELKTLIGITNMFGAGLFKQIAELKARQVEDRDVADILYTSSHKSKGLEYPKVQLLGFIDQWDIEDIIRTGEYPKRSLKEKKEGKEHQGIDYAALTEELNCAYVAITRAQREVEVLPDPFDEVPEMVQRNREVYAAEKALAEDTVTE